MAQHNIKSGNIRWYHFVLLSFFILNNPVHSASFFTYGGKTIDFLGKIPAALLGSFLIARTIKGVAQKDPMKNIYPYCTREQINAIKAMKEDGEHNSNLLSSNRTGPVLKYIASLPWGKYAQSRITDLKLVRKKLDDKHYGLTKVKEEILDYLAVYSIKKEIPPQILCLVGPPGIGKTSIAQSIAEVLGRPCEIITLGGLSEAYALNGLPNFYHNSTAGKLISAVNKTGAMNSVLILDEIDKMGKSAERGDPAAVLLEVLNPKQSKTFRDNYLEIPFDLSNIFFITTANDESGIPESLLDRMKIIRLPNYTLSEKLSIAQNHLIKESIKNTGLENHKVHFDKPLLQRIITHYTHEAGVRDLSRHITTLCSKISRSIIERGTVPEITVKNLHSYLGQPRITAINKNDTGKTQESHIGVVNGLAVTGIGGDILPIEVIQKPGKGNIKITGQIGKVMHESVQVALSFIQANWQRFGIKEKALDQIDLHIHAPEGAIPKDGPSAGITIAAAILSTLKQQPVDGNYAMTGEIDLHGNVGAIGGLKEKILAAKRRGIKNIIIPAINTQELEEDPELTEGVTIIPVTKCEEVFNHLLLSQTQTKKLIQPVKN